MAGKSSIAVFLLAVVCVNLTQGRVPGRHHRLKRTPFVEYLNYEDMLKQEKAEQGGAASGPAAGVLGLAKKVPGAGAVPAVGSGDADPVSSYYESFAGGAGKKLPVSAVTGVGEGNPLEQYYGGGGLGAIGKDIPVAGSALNGASAQDGEDETYYYAPIEDKKDEKMARLKQADVDDANPSDEGLKDLSGAQDALKITPKQYKRFSADPTPSLKFTFKEKVKDGVTYYIVANDLKDVATLKDIIVGHSCLNPGEAANIRLEVGPNGKHKLIGFGERSATITCNGEDPKFICKNDNGVKKYDVTPTIVLADGGAFMIIIRIYRSGEIGWSLFSTKKGPVSQTVKEQLVEYIKKFGFNEKEIAYFDHTGNGKATFC